MRKTQAEIVYNHLRKFGSINSLEAIRRYGITRISAVIYNLRRSGIPISAKQDIPTAPHFVTYRIDYPRLKEVQFEKLKEEATDLVLQENLTIDQFANAMTDYAIRARQIMNTTQ